MGKEDLFTGEVSQDKLKGKDLDQPLRESEFQTEDQSNISQSQVNTDPIDEGKETVFTGDTPYQLKGYEGCTDPIN